VGICTVAHDFGMRHVLSEAEDWLMKSRSKNDWRTGALKLPSPPTFSSWDQEHNPARAAQEFTEVEHERKAAARQFARLLLMSQLCEDEMRRFASAATAAMKLLNDVDRVLVLNAALQETLAQLAKCRAAHPELLRRI
jgi:hypothetical protein